jgi:hypothetical protein
MGEIFHNDKAVTVEIMHTLPDMVRQHDEKAKIASDRQIGTFVNDASVALINFMTRANLKIDKVEVIETLPKLVLGDNHKYNGTVDFTVNALQAGKTKKASIRVTCTDGVIAMPDTTALSAELNTIVSNEDASYNAMVAKDAEMKQAAKELVDGFEKAASAGPVAGAVITPVIHVDKTWLPSSLKAGDTVSLDGVRYAITGDDHNKLSASSDGSFWTLRVVDETMTPKTNVKRMIV